MKKPPIRLIPILYVSSTGKLVRFIGQSLRDVETEVDIEKLILIENCEK